MDGKEQQGHVPESERSAARDHWRPVARSRASSAIVEQVRATLFAGAQPGEWLGTERELAERFEVSRTTVRDAVRTLEANGIIEVQVGAKGGIRIARGDPQRFADALAVQLSLVGIERADVLDAQRVIERVTVERAARFADEEDLAGMRRLLKSAAHAIGDADESLRLNLEFHLAIAHASKSTVFSAFLTSLRGEIDRHYRPDTTPAVSAAVLSTHWELYELIAAGDPGGAVARMEAHLDDTEFGAHVQEPTNDPKVG